MNKGFMRKRYVKMDGHPAEFTERLAMPIPKMLAQRDLYMML